MKSPHLESPGPARPKDAPCRSQGGVCGTTGIDRELSHYSKSKSLDHVRRWEKNLPAFLLSFIWMLFVFVPISSVLGDADSSKQPKPEPQQPRRVLLHHPPPAAGPGLGGAQLPPSHRHGARGGPKTAQQRGYGLRQEKTQQSCRFRSAPLPLRTAGLQRWSLLFRIRVTRPEKGVVRWWGPAQRGRHRLLQTFVLKLRPLPATHQLSLFQQVLHVWGLRGESSLMR